MPIVVVARCQYRQSDSTLLLNTFMVNTLLIPNVHQLAIFVVMLWLWNKHVWRDGVQVPLERLALMLLAKESTVRDIAMSHMAISRQIVIHIRVTVLRKGTTSSKKVND